MKKCLWCQEELVRRDNERPAYFRVRQCCNDAHARLYRHRKTSKEPERTKVCPVCRKEYKRRIAEKENLARFLRRETCGRICQYKYRSMSIKDVAGSDKGDVIVNWNRQVAKTTPPGSAWGWR